jgi:palmitoyltransferase
MDRHSNNVPGYITAFLGLALYALLNWSYTTAVFTDPGSPLLTTPTSGYSALPTSEPSHNHYSSLTVKSTGEMRFCKKCQCKKPDRAHHCSTCKRCVLKMDHHCPWLATCVGLRNYKPFLLFLIYTTLFCWVCFGVSAMWIWDAIIVNNSVEESFMPVNYILLSVLSGIIGLVVGGFTAWHVHLTLKGKTTIESLESTRYLSPIRQQVAPHLAQQRTYVEPEDRTLGEQIRHIGDQLIETHANALPGVLRPEEGEERQSPAQHSLQRAYNWDVAERQRERDRYMEYLDEQYNEKLPNAFDLGWRTNWRRVMGNVPWLWGIPICNAMGDGWTWEVSEKWREASERMRLRKEEEMARSGLSVPIQQQGAQAPLMYDPNAPLPHQRGSPRGWRAPEHRSGASTPMRDLQRSDEGEAYETSSDEENLADARARLLRQKHGENWNDLPEDMVGGSRRSPRPGRRKDR